MVRVVIKVRVRVRDTIVVNTTQNPDHNQNPAPRTRIQRRGVNEENYHHNVCTHLPRFIPSIVFKTSTNDGRCS